ncbi:hypothetical protein TcWFU_002004 [Taenia crassiceps]|uniref:Fibronectin type-III domain-containing protein n=1 Tax=Taenia crassiceps TaxID=6207 RepID=A0ABR4Q7R6_9CEST
MRKPTFEATQHADFLYLRLSIHDPLDVQGGFGGYEVLMKSGGVLSQNPWRSVASLTAKGRNYEMNGTEALKLHTITVWGRVLPDNYSELADSVEFIALDRELSAPQNVQLVAVDSHTVHMTWNPPVQSYGRITNYTISWSVNRVGRLYIHLGTERFYTSSNGNAIHIHVNTPLRREMLMQRTQSAVDTLYSHSTQPRLHSPNKAILQMQWKC